ncbi:MAG: glycosyltransferase [Bryobacteraceae bacterium]
MADEVYQAPIPPKVSVILAVRNQLAELRRTIVALENSHDREQLEILVVDRASDDGTSALDEEFPSVTMLRLPHDFGNTRAMNIATRTAKAETLFYLSPGVEVFPETVMALAERLQNDAASVALCPLLVDSDGQPVPQILPVPDPAFFREAAERLPAKSVPATNSETVDAAYPGSDAILVRRHFVAGMNYFDERLGHHWADADLALQIRRAGRKIRICTGIRALWDPPMATPPNDIPHQADRILGAAVLLGKYYGFFSGFSFRWGAILGALLSLKLSLCGALLSDRKLDGADAT